MLHKNSFKDSFRMIGAIASKDILEGAKNRVILSIAFGVIIMMLSGQILPWLLGLKDTPKAIVYDPGRSKVIRSLQGQENYVVGTVDSIDEMFEIIYQSPEPVIGVELPANFDQLAGSGELLVLPGYYPHWMDSKKVTQRVAYFEELFGQASWQTIQINVMGGEQYPPVDAEGRPFMASLVITMTVVIIGVVLVPYLLVEEKENHTINVLLVSPAKYSHIIFGKTLAGLCYCSIAAFIAVLFDWRLFIHWDVLVVSLVLGALFAVAVGMLVGIIVENPGSTNIWGGISLLIILGPLFMQIFSNIQYPNWLDSLLDWYPSVALNRQIQMSMAEAIIPSQAWLNIGVLGVSIGVLLFLVHRFLRRMEF